MRSFGRLDRREGESPDAASRLRRPKLFNRLRKIELTGRLGEATPPLLTRVLVTLVLLGIVMAVRRGVDMVAPGLAPFAILYPAVLVATLLAGWTSGAALSAIGGVVVWRVVMRHAEGFGPGFQGDIISLALYLLSAAAIVVVAEAFRINARNLAAGQAALQASEDRLELATAAAQVGVWEWRLQTGEMIYSPEARTICGFPAQGPVTYEMATSVTHPEDYPQTSAQAARALDPSIRDESPYEYRLKLPDGEVRWVSVNGKAIFETVDGKTLATRYVGTIQDITARKSAEELTTLLAREVDHRANNLLTVVLGTVQLSQAETPEALREVLTGRIAALGRAHQLLSEARWEGADLRRLVDEELLGFSLGDGERVSVDGVDIALSPPAAQGLAMALHELATNAAKYGALSKPKGRVAVSWARLGEGPLILRGEESGGPKVTKPSRRGLGTTMLERALAGPLGGCSRLDWRPQGLVCELELPGEALEMAGAKA